ncbi:MAG: hypothetical protein AB1552_07435 [Nitrospirota bacterium]
MAVKPEIEILGPEGVDKLLSTAGNHSLRGAGLRQVTFRSLGHGNASIRIQSGQNIRYIQT